MTVTFATTVTVDNTIDASVKEQIRENFEKAAIDGPIEGLMNNDEEVTKASDDDTFDKFFARVLELKGGYRRRRPKRSRRPRKSRRSRRSRRRH
jgi:hypothetical protein